MSDWLSMIQTTNLMLKNGLTALEIDGPRTKPESRPLVVLDSLSCHEIAQENIPQTTGADMFGECVCMQKHEDESKKAPEKRQNIGDGNCAEERICEF